LARLNPDGTVDQTFNVGSGVNGPVYAMRIQADGKVLFGGDFTSVNGTPFNHIARVNSDGSLDLTFNSGSGADGVVYAIDLDQPTLSFNINRNANGGPQEDDNVIDVTGISSGVLTITYDMFNAPDDLRVYYGTTLIFDTGLVAGSNTVNVP